MQQCSDSHLTKWLLTATYWRLGLCPQNFTSTGHWILLGFNFIVKLLHFEWLQPHLPDKRKYFQKLSNVFKFQEHTQTNLYAKISALNILFSWKCWKTIASRSFWFHLQPGRYKLCTHKNQFVCKNQRIEYPFFLKMLENDCFAVILVPSSTRPV